jgi:hypothetical protein
MASAGMKTVTNTFENKTAEALRAISPNLIPAEPSVDGVAAGLREALAAAADYEGRVAGAVVDWPTRWEDSFDDAVIDRVVSFLDGS